MQVKPWVAMVALICAAGGPGAAPAYPAPSEASSQETPGAEESAMPPPSPESSASNAAVSGAVETALEQTAAAHAAYKPLVYETIWAAVEANDIYDVDNHLLRGVDINATRPDGTTVLHQAARAGDIYMIGHLLARGAKINGAREGVIFPIVSAEIARRDEAVRFLGQRGAPYSVPQAISCGDTKSLGEFLDRNPKMIAGSLPSMGFVQVLTSEIVGANSEDSLGPPKTLLLVAAQRDRMDVVQFLLSRGASFARDLSGVDALFYAAMHGNEALVRLIAADGLDFGAQAQSGETALAMLVAKGGPAAMIDLLVELGASVSAPIRGGVTPLHIAAKRGDVPAAEALLRHGARVDRKDNVNRTPIFYAAENGRTEAVKYLAGHAASLSVTDRRGRTPLHVAAARNRLKTLEALVEAGAGVTAQDGAGWTALHYAAQAGNLQMVTLLLSKGAAVTQPSGPCFTAMHAAAQAGQDAVLDCLLSHGVPGDLLDRDHRTPLYYVLESRYLSAAELLIGHGADVNAVDAYGETPLFPAVRTAEDVALPVELTTLLLDCGADVKVKDNQGRTPLHAAAESGCVDTARPLIEKGAEIDPKDTIGNTPLYWAAASPDPRLFDLLVSLGADLHVVNGAGQTLMHAVATRGAAKTASYLIAQGLDVNALDGSGMAPIHYAAENGQSDVVRVLAKAHADLHIRAKDSRTALTMARERRDRMIEEAGTVPGRRGAGAKYDRTFYALRSLIACCLGNAAGAADIEELRKLTRLYPQYVDEEVGYVTPLERAIGANSMAAIKLLVLSGANPEGLARGKKKAHELAMEKGYTEIAGFLKAYQDALRAEGLCPMMKRAIIGEKIVKQYSSPAVPDKTAPVQESK